MFGGRAIAQGAFADLGNTNYLDMQAEALALTSTHTGVLQAVVSRSESIGLTDTSTGLRFISSSITEVLNISELDTAIAVFLGSRVEPLGISNVITVRADVFQSQLESIVPTATQLGGRLVSVGSLETIGVTAVHSGQRTTVGTVSELLGLLNRVSVRADLLQNQREVLTESVIHIGEKTIHVTVADTLNSVDLNSALLFLIGLQYESIGVLSTPNARADLLQSQREVLTLLNSSYAKGWFIIDDKQNIIWTNINNTQ